MGAQKYRLGLKQIVAISCLVMAVVCLGASTAAGAGGAGGDYYVDINTGDDTNDGLYDTVGTPPNGPWKTLHHAFGAVPAGLPGTPTILHVATGTYNVTSGEADATHWIGSTTSNVYIKGEGWPEINGVGAGYWPTGIRIDADGVTVEGFKITGFNTGIYISWQSSEIKRNIIYGIATTGIYIYCSAMPVSPLIQNNVLYNVGGNGVYIDSYGSPGTPRIYHNTINGVASGRGIYIYEMGTSGGVTPDISFNLITNHSSTGGIGIENMGPGVPSLNYNNFNGNTTPYTAGLVSQNESLFPPSYVAAGDGNYHLDPASECIDVIPALFDEPVSDDIDGDIRNSLNEGYDIGADEVSPSSSIIGPGTYYVNSATGSDANDGLSATVGTSPSGPWQTLHYAITQINSGTAGNYTLRVAAGLYAKDVLGGHEPNDVLKITQSNLTIIGAGSSGSDATTTRIDGTGTTYGGWRDGFDIWSLDSDHLTTNVIIQKMIFRNFYANGIHMGGATNCVIDACNLYNNGDSGVTIETNGAYTPVPSSGNIIRNGCQIYHNSRGGVYISESSNNQIGHDFGSTYDINRIFDNIATDAAMTGVSIDAGSTGNRILQNAIYATGNADYPQEIGVYVYYAGSGNQVIGNTIYGHQGDVACGIYADSSSPDIMRNILHDNTTGIGIFVFNGTASPRIWNNLIYGDAVKMDDGISLDLSLGTMAPQIYHNTIDGGANSGIYVSGALPTIKFNAITNFGTSGIEIESVPESPDPIVAMNNIYKEGSTNYYLGFDTPPSPTVDLHLNPLYVGTGDYHLQVGSPCIDAISPPGTVNIDLSGTARPQPAGGNFDIGCYEALEAYTVTFVTDGTAGATLSGTLSQTVFHGGSGTPVRAVAPTGYEFVKWTLGNADYSVNNPLTVTNVTSDMTLKAVFAVADYTVTFVTDGTAGATLSGTLSQTVVHGSSCSPVRALAPAGYEFVKWTLGNADYSVNNPLTVTNVTSDMTLKAVFALTTYTVTFVTDGTPGATLTGTVSQTVAHGGNATPVKAVAPAGYIFVKWTWIDSDYSSVNPLTVTNVTSDMALTAVFASNAFTVTFVTDGTPGARLSGTVSQTVVRGGTCTPVSAVAPTGYNFIKWTIAGETYSTNRSVTVANVTSNMVLTAVFSAFSTDTYTVTFITDGTAGAVLNGVLSQTVVSGGSCSPVEAVAPSGYVFVGWATLSGDVVSTNSSLTVTNVTYNMTRMAVFAVKTYAVNFVTDGTAGATLTGEVNQAVAPGGSGTPVEAVAPVGYVFVKWTWNGSDYSNANPLTVTNVTSAMALKAVFAEKAYTVKFITDGTAGASLIGTVSQKVALGGNCTPVEAVAPSGYVFVKWTWDGEDYSNANPLTVTNVTSSKALTAVFAKDAYTVKFITDGTAGALLIGTVSQAVAFGGNCTSVEAVAPAGYTFMKWTLAGEDYAVENPLTVANVTSDMVLTGVFVPFGVDTYTVNFVTDGTAGATLSGAGSQTVIHGGRSTPVKAVAPAGYVFVKWTLDGADYSQGNPLTVANVTGSMTFTAEFEENTGNQPPEKPVLIAPVDNAVVPSGPFTLQSGPYSDPENDPHVSTGWKISMFNSSQVLYNEISGTDLTSHEITDLDEGLKYAWRAGYQDMGSGDYTWSDSESFIVGQVTVDENMPPVEPGIDIANYRMISFIQWPADQSAEAVFGPLMGGGYDTAMFRIGTYDPTYGNGGYREYPDFTVEPGRPCWFLARDGLDLSFSGVPVSTSVDFCMGLEFNAANANGWNMVAPPNDRDYRWGDLQVTVKDNSGNTVFGPMAISQLPAENEYIDVRIFGWDQGAYTASTLPEFLLERYSGYWVRTKQPNVHLCFPADAGIASRSGGIEAMYRLITAWVGDLLPETATAYANAPDDAPPMPMGALAVGKSEGGGGGCFIDTVTGSND